VDKFNAKDYYEAAIQRFTEAEFLYRYNNQFEEDIDFYSIAIYLAGHSVECMFRAYDRLENPKGDLDSKHGINYWSRKSPLILDDRREYPQFSKELKKIEIRWKNNHRFRNYDRMMLWLKNYNLDRGIKGDYVKENCRVLLDAARIIIKLGKERNGRIIRKN